jgi:UDP-glucose 4-epimerase
VKLLLTGASGFIGRNVLLRAPRDWEIVAVYWRSANLEAFVRSQALSHVRTVACDLMDETAVRRLADSAGRADAALYLAANGDPAASTERPRWDLESNTITLINFLEHCAPDHLVYISSGAVYDGLVGPVSPESAVAPRLPYAISKLACEQYVRFFAERRRRLNSFINVRFFGAYGPYEAPRKITTRWLQAIAAGQREFVLRGDGRNLIDFMYVDEAVDGLLTLTKARGTTATLDFASGAPVTVNQIVEAMARLLGVSVTIRHQGETEEYIQFQTNDQAMRQRFGFVPKITFDEGLKKLNAFFERVGARG